MTVAAWIAGKTVLVTGATGGIGKATAAGLAGLGARVGITGRDRARADAAAADIRASGGPGVDIFVADMSSQDEVRGLAVEVLDAYPRLDVLVNNVGGSWAHRHTTVDGLEYTFALNHLAPFLLTNLLIERLRASAPARIVTVSSGAHAAGRIDFDDLQGERAYSVHRAYSQSKLANVMFTYELARRLDGSGVTATVLHPGVVRTGFGAEDRGPMDVLAVGHLDLPGLRPECRGSHRALLRWPRAEGIQQALLRHRCSRQVVADQRRPGRSASRQRSLTPAAALWSRYKR
jgi:retinol dehydrogenase 14